MPWCPDLTVAVLGLAGEEKIARQPAEGDGAEETCHRGGVRVQPGRGGRGAASHCHQSQGFSSPTSAQSERGAK